MIFNLKSNHYRLVFNVWWGLINGVLVLHFAVSVFHGLVMPTINMIVAYDSVLLQNDIDLIII